MQAVSSQEGLEVYAVALSPGVERGLGVEALQKMLLHEHGVTVSSKRQLRTWIDRTKGAELEPVTSQEGLEVHAAALRPRFERGHTRVCRDIYQFRKVTTHPIDNVPIRNLIIAHPGWPKKRLNISKLHRH